MPRTFKTLTEHEKEEMLVNTLKAQELDLYMHTINKERYEDMIEALPVENEFRKRLEAEVTVVDSRLVEVNTIITSLEKQIPADIDYAVVLERIKAKEKGIEAVPVKQATDVITK